MTYTPGIPISDSNALPVTGGGASGSAPIGNPMLVSGSDGSVVRTISTDTSGVLKTTGTVNHGSTDSGAPQKLGGVAATAPAAVSTGQRVNAWFTLEGAGVVRPTLSPVSGSDGWANSAIGVVPRNTDTTAQLYPIMAVTLFNGTSWDRQKKANLTARLLSSAATTNATSVKALAGDLFRIAGNNNVASKRYLKLYNKASAPTVGTDTPVLTFVLAASAPFAIDFGANGQYFSAGISYAITGAAADADTTAIAAGDIECLNLTYA